MSDKQLTDEIIEKISNNFWYQLLSELVRNIMSVAYSVIYCTIKGFIAWILWGWFLTDYIAQPQPLTVVGICILVFFATNNGRTKYEGLKTYKDMLFADSAYLFMVLVTGSIVKFW
jgi:hypothetical protein